MQDRPKVYVDVETGDQSAEFCELGKQIGRGLPTTIRTGCPTMFCACAADGELRAATPEETKAFWETLWMFADERAASSRW